MARRWSFRAEASVRKARPPTSSRFHVITLLRQPWQRPCVPSGICWRPCSNTKQPPLLFPSRLRVRPTACKTPSPQRQSADSRSQRADLALESTSYLHSRSFVVHSTSGGVSPLVTALTSVLWLQPQRRVAPSPSGETELSRHPRHATAADGDSDLPLPHTRDATTLLCSTAYDDNWAESELRTQ